MGFVERKTHFPCFLLKWVLLEKKPFQQNPFSLLFVDMGFVEKRFCWKKPQKFQQNPFSLLVWKRRILTTHLEPCEGEPWEGKANGKN